MKFRHSLIFVIVICNLLLACRTAPPGDAEKPVSVKTKARDPILYGWLQWLPGTVLQARAIVSLGFCPKLVTDQGALLMTPRGAATAAFPDLACEALVPPKAKWVELQMEDENLVDASAIQVLKLSLPSQKMKRIVLIGDTGCRLKEGYEGRPGAYQACNDPKAWPFKAVAESAAKLRPDMIIHLGDIHYREAACPPGNAGCAGAVYGYDWPAWEADFFSPAKHLLPVAPWIFVRGNHESCTRAGAGWFQFLEPKFAPCQPRTEPFSLKFGANELVVVDGAEADNMAPSFAKLKKQQGHRWLMVHRPFLTGNRDKNQPSESLLPEALFEPGQLSFILAGHVHALMLNQFADRRPSEFIIGNGATALQKDVDFYVKKPGDEFVTFLEFGFLSMEQKSAGRWLLKVHGVEGQVLKTCNLQESFRRKTRLTCL